LDEFQASLKTVDSLRARSVVFARNRFATVTLIQLTKLTKGIGWVRNWTGPALSGFVDLRVDE